MKDVKAQISQLCENWWAEMADAARPGQPRYAEKLLHYLGWDMPLPFSPREAAARLNATPYLLRAGGQTSLACYFLLPGTLEQPGPLAERGLDFCRATRTLVSEAQALSVHYVLATDFYRSYLYDALTDELLLWSDTPAAFNDSIAPVIEKEAMERGSLEEVRRMSRSGMARQLREWGEFWATQYVKTAGLEEARAYTIIDRLLVTRYLFAKDVLRRTRWRLEQRFLGLVERAGSHRPEGAGRELNKLFRDMGTDWGIELFDVDPYIEDAVANDVLTAAMLAEFGLMSRARFSISTVLETFNHGDPQEKMRVRMVPDHSDERERYLAKQTLRTMDSAFIQLDLAEEGYRALFHWFDKVVAMYERLEAEQQAKLEAQPEVPGDADLFEWSQMDSAHGAGMDKLAFACQHGLRVYYDTPRQFRVARLMLTLHVISRYHQQRRPVDRLPRVTTMLVARPKHMGGNPFLAEIQVPHVAALRRKEAG
jgi:hypothetical protein